MAENIKDVYPTMYDREVYAAENESLEPVEEVQEGEEETSHEGELDFHLGS